MDTSSTPSHNAPSQQGRLLANAYPHHPNNTSLGTITLNLLWILAHFLFSFLIQLTELFSPILLILGVGWALIPHLITLASANLGSLTEDPQTHDIVNHISHTLPNRLVIEGHIYTPHTLIFDGLALMALAAASSTAAAWLGRRL